MKRGKRSCEPPKVIKSNIRSVLANTQYGTEFKVKTVKPITRGDVMRLAEFKCVQKESNSVYCNKQKERSVRILEGRKVIYVQ